MNYLQEQAIWKLTEYYSKLVHFFQALKLTNCIENHPDFVQKHDGKSVPHNAGQGAGVMSV